MEIDVNTKKIFCSNGFEEKKATLPVECSIILPDYFPDVMKILRYTAKTVKSPIVSDAAGETVSGNVSVEVSYVSEEGELCSCSRLQPFSHTFDCGNIAAAEAEITVGEMGCRAVNKRRIDLSGSIEAVLRTLSGEELPFVSEISGGDCVCKKESSETVIPVGEFCKSFTVEEKGELGYGKEPFGKVLRASAFGEITECHVIQDKIVTKGEAKITLLWESEPDQNGEASTYKSNFSFPISRMLEAEGILLTDICDARYEAQIPEVTPTDGGQNVSIKLKIEIFARVYRKVNCEYITDMFSTSCESKSETAKLSIINEAVPVSFTENILEKIDLPESAETVTDIWPELGTPYIKDGTKLGFSVKLCMFAKDESENPLYFEKTYEREVNLSVKPSPIAFWNIALGVKNEDFSFEHGKSAEFTCDVLIDGTVYTGLSTEALTSCNLSTDKKFDRDSAAIILYYAEKDENLWDIAKHYRAKIEDIKSENSLLDDILPKKTMLVIPK